MARYPLRSVDLGRGGLPGCGRSLTSPWGLWSLCWSRRSADDVVFPLAGRGGEGEKGDGTTALLFRVMCALLVVCGCSVLQLPPTGLGDEERRRLDVSTSKPARWWSVLLRLGSTTLGSSSRGTASSSPSPTRPMVWKKKK
jgi:hypothetical protein